MKKIEKLGLYIHIPFCRQKCTYCDFFSSTDFNDKIIEKYFDELIVEFIIRFKDYYSSHDKCHYIINTIYIGGGTPSVVPTYIYERFFSKLFSIIDINHINEMTIEVNPESLNDSLLAYMSKYSFSRISLGIQTINNSSLTEINRIAKTCDIDNALKIINTFGMQNVSFDFIHSLPHNGVGQSKKDIDYILDRFAAKHISLYFLEIDNHHHMRGVWEKLSMSEDDSIDDYNSTLEHLYSNGFKRYEISNFSTDYNYQSMHNNHYWDLDDYIAIGVSASGCYNNMRYTNTKDLSLYFLGVENACLEQSTEKLNRHIREKEFIFLSMRKSSGLDIYKYKNIFGEIFFDKYNNVIEQYKNYFVIADDSISLTDFGMLHYNTIVSSFFV